jgi:hypoxia up-regulated 1
MKAQIMSVDLGNEYFKVALMKKFSPPEIVLDMRGGRKTPTAVSFYETSRSFGNDAVAHFSKAPGKVPMFFHHMLDNNYTADDVKANGQWWKDFGLSPEFYPYVMEYLHERGVPAFKLGEKSFAGEQVLANILYSAQKMVQTTTDVGSVRDVVITVPSDANLRFRQAVIAAAEIAGLNVLSLVHEGTAFAIERARDLSLNEGDVEHVLFYNVGSRKAEASIVKFEKRRDEAGKLASVVTILGSEIDYAVGGHFMDLKIAKEMLKKFQAKHPHLADGIAKSPRAMRKLISQAAATKATLSANKAAPFVVESLYDDVDFSTTIKREDFEGMCKDMFDRLSIPIESVLKKAHVTMDNINHVELIGGAWRVPRVQKILSGFIEMTKTTSSKLPLGQHLNAEESGALGAGLIGANYSKSFKIKDLWLTDLSSHSYAVQVTSFSGALEKNRLVLFPAGSPLGATKRLSFQLEEDFQIKLFEDGSLISEYAVTGLSKYLAGTRKDSTIKPTISVDVNLEISGLLELKTPLATIEDVQTERKHETSLDVKRIDYKPLPMTQPEIKASATLLEQMAQVEVEVFAVNQLKNDLESAIYAGREKCDMENFSRCSTEAKKQQIMSLCTEYEEWMSEGSIAKGEYESRLKKLRDLLAPVEDCLADM